MGTRVPGNIDLFNRPKVKNADGSTSTVLSTSFNINGAEVLLPTVSDDGRIMTDDEAVEQFKKTGKHLGIFDNPQDADAYASQLHEDQEKLYLGDETVAGPRYVRPSVDYNQYLPAPSQAARMAPPPEPGMLEMLAQSLGISPDTLAMGKNAWNQAGNMASDAGQVLQNDPSGLEWAGGIWPSIMGASQDANAAIRSKMGRMDETAEAGSTQVLPDMENLGRIGGYAAQALGGDDFGGRLYNELFVKPVPGVEELATQAIGSVGNYFFGGDEEASPTGPSSLEQRLRSRLGPSPNQGVGGMPNSHRQTFDLGRADILPREAFEQAVPGAVAPPDYMSLTKYLNQPELVKRQTAGPTDFSASDTAYAAAAPEAPELEDDWNGILGGLSRALGSGNFNSIDTGQLLLAAGSGALSGLTSTQDQNRELKREYDTRRDEYELGRAGYEANKAGVRRSETQEGFDADYQSRLDYERSQDTYGAQLAQFGGKTLDADFEARQHASAARAAGINSKRAAQLAYLKQLQPEYKVMPTGAVMITTTDKNTGQRQMTMDNSNVWEAAKAKVFAESMGGDGKSIMKLYGPGPGNMSSYEPVWNLSVQMAQSPELAKSVLPEGKFEEIVGSAQMIAGDDEEMMARYLGNSIYAEMMNLTATEPEIVEQMLDRFGMLQ
jgi:hypothetical protein